MRLYRNLVEAAVSCLYDIFVNESNPESCIRIRTQKNRSWGSRDRRFLSSMVYDIIRSMRLYVHILNRRPVSNKDFYDLTAIYFIHQQIDLPDWEQYTHTNRADIHHQICEGLKTRHLKFAMPQWLDQLGHDYYPDRWDDILNQLESRAPVFIRVNHTKTNREELSKVLHNAGIESKLIHEPSRESALQINTKSRLTSLPAFNNGLFEIQDLSSQLIAPYMELASDMTIVDACAGAGGKTLHIADTLHHQGMIHCFDIHAVKLKNLQKRARRTGLHNYKTHLVSKINNWAIFDQLADRVLIDAPCTGFGTLRRKPILKWRLNERWYRSIQKTQQQVLQQYAPMCKKGGLLIYATCSILPSENNEQIDQFLKTEIGQDFECLDQVQIIPSESSGDGFYMAKLKRNDH